MADAQLPTVQIMLLLDDFVEELSRCWLLHKVVFQSHILSAVGLKHTLEVRIRNLLPWTVVKKVYFPLRCQRSLLFYTDCLFWHVHHMMSWLRWFLSFRAMFYCLFISALTLPHIPIYNIERVLIVNSVFGVAELMFCCLAYALWCFHAADLYSRVPLEPLKSLSVYVHM